MPVYQLGQDIVFPPPKMASRSGILAIGGDLSPGRLLEAYRQGIFPWYSEEDPIIWWSPDPRFILFPEEIRISRSMKKTIRRNVYKITYDHSFHEVVSSCQNARRREKGTWITSDMHEAYCYLHNLGYAHSVEAWYGEKLVGGLYGVSLGRCFFGESMFSLMSNASKAALLHLVEKIKNLGFKFLDCQVYTAHMESLGARYVSRDIFLSHLNGALEYETFRGNWRLLSEFQS